MSFIGGVVKQRGTRKLDIHPPKKRKIFSIEEGVPFKQAEKIVNKLEKRYVNFVYDFTGFPLGVGLENAVLELKGTWSKTLAPKDYFQLFCFPFESGYLSVACPWQGDLKYGKHSYLISYHGTDTVNKKLERSAVSHLKTMLRKSREIDKQGYELIPKNKRYVVDSGIFLQEAELFSQTWANLAKALSGVRIYRLFAYPKKKLFAGWNASLKIDFYPGKENAFLMWTKGDIVFPQFRIYSNDIMVMVVNQNNIEYLKPREIFSSDFVLAGSDIINSFRAVWKEAQIYRALVREEKKKDVLNNIFWELIKKWVEFI